MKRAVSGKLSKQGLWKKEGGGGVAIYRIQMVWRPFAVPNFLISSGLGRLAWNEHCTASDLNV